jgi:TP901 family phage tail tape measure protein
MTNDNKTVNLYINTKGASASIKELRKDAAVLNNELGKMDPTTQEFIEKSKDLQKVKDRLTEVRKAASGVKEEVKTVTQEVKNSGGTFTNFKSLFISAFSIGAVINAGRAVIGFFMDSIRASTEFKKSLSELSAITGATGKDLSFLASEAKASAKEHGILARDVVEAYKLIGSAKPELLKNKEALAQITSEAITLSKAAGMELPEAATALTAALNQFSAPAKEAGKYINVLAAGSKEGAAEIPDITASLLNFGVAAKASNVSIEESVALIETLAEKGKKGADAGVGLRNVLAKLSAPDTLPKSALNALKVAGVDINVLSDATQPFMTRLTELSKIQGDASAITKVFGLENQNVAQILIENRELFGTLTTKITGTNIATEQARIATDNLAGDYQKFSSVLNTDTVEMAESSDGMLRGIVQFATEALKNTEPLADAFNSVKTVVGSLFDSLGRLITQIFGVSVKGNGAQITMKVLATVLNALFTPLKLVAGGTTLVTDGFNILVNTAKKAMNFFGADFKIDPSASFETLKNNLKKNSEDIAKSYQDIWTDTKETSTKAIDDISAQSDQAAKEEEERKKQEMEAYKQRQEEIKARRARDLEQEEKDRIKADENIRKLQEKNLSDSLEDRIKKLQMQAQAELSDLKGTEQQKAQQRILIQQNLEKDIQKLKDDARDKDIKDEQASEKEKQRVDQLYEEQRNKAILASLDIEIVLAKNNQEKLLELKKARLRQEYEYELQNKNLTDEERRRLEVNYQEGINELDKKYTDQKLNNYRDKASEALGFLSQSVQIIQDFSHISNDKQIQDSENTKNARISQLDQELARKKISQEKYDKERKKAEDQAAKQQAAIKTKQAEGDKRANIAQAVIATALAVIKALPNPFMVAFAAAIGAANIAKIIATPIPKFAKGGSTAKAMTGVRTSMPTVMHGGYVDQPLIAEFGEAGPEYVVPNWMLSNPRVADMVSVMEAVRSSGSFRGFAVGGSTTPGAVTPAPAGSSSEGPDNAIFHLIYDQLVTLNSTAKSWPTKLEADISYDKIDYASNLVNTIQTESKLTSQ